MVELYILYICGPLYNKTASMSVRVRHMYEVSSKQTPKIWDTFTSANFLFIFVKNISFFYFRNPFLFFQTSQTSLYFFFIERLPFQHSCWLFWLTPSECTYNYSNSYNPGIQPHQQTYHPNKQTNCYDPNCLPLLAPRSDHSLLSLSLLFFQFIF